MRHIITTLGEALTILSTREEEIERLRAALELAVKLLRESFADDAVWEMYWAKSKEARPIRVALAGGAETKTVIGVDVGRPGADCTVEATFEKLPNGNLRLVDLKTEGKSEGRESPNPGEK